MFTPPGISINPATGCLVVKPCLETPHITVTSPADLTVYASPAGSDSASGSSPATAVQTLRRALEIVETTGWNDTAVVRLLPGSYPVAGGFLSIIPPYGRQATSALRVTGDSMSVALAGLTVLGVAGGGSIPWELTVSAPVTDALDGLFAEFLTGALAPRRFAVGRAGGAAFRIMYADNPPPAPGDTLRVLAPNAFIEPAGLLAIAPVIPMQFADVEFVVPPLFTGLTVFFGSPAIFLNAVRFTPTPGSPISGVEFLGRILMGLDSGMTPLIVGGPGATFVGEPAHNMLVFSPLGAALLANGCFVRDGDLQLQPGATLGFDSGMGHRAHFESGGAALQLNRSQILASPSTGVAADDGSTLVINQGDISACAGSGVFVRGARLSLSGVTSIDGPNGGVGLELAEQVQGRLNGSAASCTLTGAGGDVTIGANPTATWADIAADLVPRSDFSALSPKYSSLAL
jgi:hypothetical protein